MDDLDALIGRPELLPAGARVRVLHPREYAWQTPGMAEGELRMTQHDPRVLRAAPRKRRAVVAGQRSVSEGRRVYC